MEYIINSFRGFCMAVADSVPGVSGGTIAFILGFYDKFINALNDLVYGTWQKKKDAFFYLIKLGIGWIVGMILAALILSSLFETHIYKVSSLFLSFIIFSIPLIIKEEKDSIKGRYRNIIFTILGISLVAAITYFNPISGSSKFVDISSINLGLGVYIFLVGMVAISAMVLPGISGSTLLLIFGLYMPIMNAIKEFLHLNLSYLPSLIIFGFGVLTGIGLVIKLIKICLEKYRSATIYTILGLMIGSIYAIIMGPTTLKVPLDSLNIHNFNIIFFILGALIIIGLEKLKKVLSQKEI